MPFPLTDTQLNTLLDEIPVVAGRPRQLEELSGGLTNRNYRIDVEGDDPRKIVEAKRALLATATKDEQFKLLTEIGDMNADKNKDFA